MSVGIFAVCGWHAVWGAGVAVGGYVMVKVAMRERERERGEGKGTSRERTEGM